MWAPSQRAFTVSLDFYSAQETAQRRSRWLLLWLLLSATLVILGLYVPVGLGALSFGLDFWQPNAFGLLAFTLGAIMAIEIAYRASVLRRGGSAVAQLLGGREVESPPRSAEERQLLNVVHEMAIASQLPVPRLFILDHEGSINAFAAGMGPHDAALGITRGALATLKRDELQGVVAHEMAHILRGDMRLNLRMMSLLSALTLFAVTGYHLIRPDDGPEGQGQGSALGLPLLVAGYLGLTLARFIKSGVSRQREFLADAAAIELTRNPSGLAGALKKIGGAGSGVRHYLAEEASHFFFASGITGGLRALIATHPPLIERIRRLEPGFDGEFPTVEPLEIWPAWIPPLPTSAEDDLPVSHARE